MKKSLIFIAIILATFPVFGAVDGYLGSADALSGSSYLVHALFISILCFGWSKADAQELALKPPRGSAILCALIPLLGVPVHLFRTRPWRRASLGLLKAVALLVLCVAAYQAGTLGGELLAA